MAKELKKPAKPIAGNRSGSSGLAGFLSSFAMFYNSVKIISLSSIMRGS